MSEIELSRGNMKLGKDTLIINMNSATDCPSKKKGLCKICDKCYAMKAEKQYKAVLPYRRRQEKYWDNNEAETIAKNIVNKVKRIRSGEIKYVRFSEAGDFNEQKDVNKMSKVSDILEKSGIRVYGYTARSDLNFDNISDNMVVMGSDFMVDNNFKIVGKNYKPKASDNVCPGNCRVCNMCKTKTKKLIKVREH